jgi:alcohol dehydrogenase, propanol-preferring
MKAVQVPRAGGAFEIVERPIPEPGPGQVLIKVEACGICHSDTVVKDGLFPNIKYPRVPGHEVAGRIEKLGPNNHRWKTGQRVGVGWFGGCCHHCVPCREGEFQFCITGEVTGLTYDGGYAEYMVAPEEAVAPIPDTLNAVEAAPLLCAGITTFNALRHSGAKAGDLVAIQGIGGLGHLGIQFARHSGYRVAAISRGADKEPLARKLGAHHYIDDSNDKAAEELQKLGGAKVILATAPSAKAINPLTGGLAKRGKLLIVAAPPDSMTVSPLELLMGSRSVMGWYSGHSKDSEDTLNFSALVGIRPMIETYPLEQVDKAYQQMLSNKARFRVVLKI